EAFVAAGDRYIGLDPSARMLAQFARKLVARGTRAVPLVQADGCALPFADASFDAVLVVQVVSGSPGWRAVFAEARRVLRPGGRLALGKTIRPDDGIDARMREQLSVILAQLGIDARRPGAGREDARLWLARAAVRTTEIVAARWEEPRSPREFLERHATGAR